MIIVRDKYMMTTRCFYTYKTFQNVISETKMCREEEINFLSFTPPPPKKIEKKYSEFIICFRAL